MALAACQGVARPPGLSGNERGEDVAAPVAVLAGAPVSKAELADFWFDRYPEEYGRTLDALVDERLAIREANAHGVRVPRAALETALTREVAARRTQLQTVYGDAVDLESEVRRAYGVDVATWRSRILSPRLHAQLLLERVVRWDTRRRPRVHARVIVVPDAARAQAVVEKLRRGADFSLTAARESIDPSGKRGGDLPWIARGDLAFPGVEARLFAAGAGELVGPLEVRVEGQPQLQIYKIIRVVEPWQGDLETSWQRLEDDLLATPVDLGEVERWRVRMRRDAEVRYYRPDGRLWTPPSTR